VAGYLHVPDMMGGGWSPFNRDPRAEPQRDAVIIGWGTGRYIRPETYPSTAPRPGGDARRRVRRLYLEESGDNVTRATSEAAPEQACPIAPVVDLVFSRWTTPILWTLCEFGRQRFVELERRITTITPKVLTQRLRQLERDGLVGRTFYPEVPPRVEYEITTLGPSLAPLFATLAEWSVNLDQVEQARRSYDARVTGLRARPNRGGR
jgi:DNA-binding HxlR family transcriptional regulator